MTENQRPSFGERMDKARLAREASKENIAKKAGGLMEKLRTLGNSIKEKVGKAYDAALLAPHAAKEAVGFGAGVGVDAAVAVGGFVADSAVATGKAVGHAAEVTGKAVGHAAKATGEAVVGAAVLSGMAVEAAGKFVGTNVEKVARATYDAGDRAVKGVESIGKKLLENGRASLKRLGERVTAAYNSTKTRVEAFDQKNKDTNTQRAEDLRARIDATKDQIAAFRTNVDSKMAGASASISEARSGLSTKVGEVVAAIAVKVIDSSEVAAKTHKEAGEATRLKAEQLSEQSSKLKASAAQKLAARSQIGQVNA